jgi:hypothetical protein
MRTSRVHSGLGSPALKDWHAVLFLVVVILLLNSRLLSPYNFLTLDQDFWLSATYPLMDSLLATPRNLVMSQAFPSFATILEHPPLYFIVSAVVFKLVGFSVLGVGVLHLACRVASTLIFYFACRKLGQSIRTSAALAALWAAFVGVCFQRPEDLGLVLLISAVYVFLPHGDAIHLRQALGAGVFAGLAILCHSSLLYLSVATFIFLVLMYRRLLRPTHYVAVAGAVLVTWSYWWLFYVWPHWEAFRVTFFGYALKHSQGLAGDYTLDYFRTLATGQDLGGERLPAFTYSAIPIVVLFLATYGDTWRRESSWATRMAPVIPLILLVLLVRGHRVHQQLVVFFTALLLIETACLFDGESWQRKGRRRLVYFVAVVSGLQAAVIVTLSALRLAGNVSAGRRCYSGLSAQVNELKRLIGGQEKIVADIHIPPEGWLTFLPTNPMYRYIALKGHTAGGLPITSHYDETFKWLILSSDIEHSRPYWADQSDPASTRYFSRHYRLVKVVNIRTPCLSQGLARFGSSRNDLYVYVYDPTRAAIGRGES